ncbi:MAG: hypothetical protein H0V51_10695, partial [Chloroflexi bacterium]|nr:hypothetical protein [Chloroflexota bacterium]
MANGEEADARRPNPAKLIKRAAPGSQRNGVRPRPPGPEQARPGANDTRDEPGSKRPAWLRRVSWPWALLLIFLVVNWLVAPLLAPDQPDRVTIPYTT